MVDPVVAILASFVVALAVAMVMAKNPINSAFCLVGLMLALGGIYAAIGAHFVAAMQIIVYAGAVMVLFVFSIMLMNMNQDGTRPSLLSWRLVLPLVCTVCFMAIFALVFCDWQNVTGRPNPDIYTLEQVKQLGGNVSLIATMMFTKAYLPFEFVGLLLPIAVAGGLVLAKREVD